MNFFSISGRLCQVKILFSQDNALIWLKSRGYWTQTQDLGLEGVPFFPLLNTETGTHTTHGIMCTGIFSMEVYVLLKIWFFIPNHLQISLLIFLWRNFHNTNDEEIAFQICMNALFCFGESNSEGEEHTGQMKLPLRQGGEGKWLLSPAGQCLLLGTFLFSTFSPGEAGGVSRVCSVMLVVWVVYP